MRWQDITIKQFQDLAKIEKKGGQDLDIKIEKVAYLEGKTMDEMDALSLGQLQELLKKYAPLFDDISTDKLLTKWTYKGVTYKLITDIRDINAGEYNELVHFSQGGDVVQSLHLLMATLVKPMKRKWAKWVEVKKDHAKVAEAMLNAPFYLSLKSAVFFCKLYMDSLRSTKPYFLRQLKTLGRTPEQAEMEYMALLTTLDGFITPKV